MIHPSLSYNQLALLCEASYYDTTSHGKRTVIKRNVNVEYDSATYYPAKGDVESVGYRVGNLLIISFRGTEVRVNRTKWHENWRDIIRDLMFFPVWTKKGWKHFGFWLGAKRWLKKNRHVVVDAVANDLTVIFVGHSLGASVAANVAHSLGKAFVSFVCLFGEPNGVFNSAKDDYFKSGLADITISLVNINDWIDNVPPWGHNVVEPTLHNSGGHSILDYVKTEGHAAHDKSSISHLERSKRARVS